MAWLKVHWRRVRGSARASRANASPAPDLRRLATITLRVSTQPWDTGRIPPDKVREPETASPARETRALPGQESSAVIDRRYSKS